MRIWLDNHLGWVYIGQRQDTRHDSIPSSGHKTYPTYQRIRSERVKWFSEPPYARKIHTSDSYEPVHDTVSGPPIVKCCHDRSASVQSPLPTFEMFSEYFCYFERHTQGFNGNPTSRQVHSLLVTQPDTQTSLSQTFYSKSDTNIIPVQS